MKIHTSLSVLLVMASLTGCAQLNAGLEQVNRALGQANSVLGSSSDQSGQGYDIADKVTAQYEIRNLKLTTEKVADNIDVRFKGRAINKSAKLVNITIHVPVYDRQGNYVTSAQTAIQIPPKETALIDKLEPFSLKEGQVLNTHKIRYVVAAY